MRCTCGADLPLDARFCHRCGKPQRDEDIAIEEAARKQPVPVLVLAEAGQSNPAALMEVSLSNAVAVKISFLVALMTILLFLLFGSAGPSDLLSMAVLGVAGAYSVFLYRRRTGVDLSTVNGARLGWYTGLFGFLILALFIAIAAVALTSPEAMVQIKAEAKSNGISEESLTQLLAILKSPTKLAAGLAVGFILFTAAPACGGALTARLLKSRPAANS